jgi:hypothetical protein
VTLIKGSSSLIIADEVDFRRRNMGAAPKMG